jgi:hypothetical protein
VKGIGLDKEKRKKEEKEDMATDFFYLISKVPVYKRMCVLSAKFSNPPLPPLTKQTTQIIA